MCMTKTIMREMTRITSSNPPLRFRWLPPKTKKGVSHTLCFSFSSQEEDFFSVNFPITSHPRCEHVFHTVNFSIALFTVPSAISPQSQEMVIIPSLAFSPNETPRNHSVWYQTSAGGRNVPIQARPRRLRLPAEKRYCGSAGSGSLPNRRCARHSRRSYSLPTKAKQGDVLKPSYNHKLHSSFLIYLFFPSRI